MTSRRPQREPEPSRGPGAAPEPDPAPGASSEPRPACEVFAAAVLPVLLHRIRNTTQLVTAVNALLANAGPDALSERRAHDLAQAAEEARELGWLFAVLSGGLGCHLAHERCEPRGLERVAQLVRDALRRAGGTLELAPELPRLTSSGPGAALCLGLGELLHQALDGSRGAAALGAERTADGRWSLGLCGGAPPLQPLDPRLAQLGAELETRGDGFALHLPGSWLAPAAADGSDGRGPDPGRTAVRR